MPRVDLAGMVNPMRAPPNRTPHLPAPTARPSAGKRRPFATGAILALATVVLILPGTLASAGASPSAAPTTLANVANPGPSESWGWGALANFSASVEYVGAYNNSMNLTGGNLTSSGASVALSESVGVEYATFVVVNATTPTAGNRYVQVEAAELRAEHIAVAASGTFPVAGNYTANATIPLANQNFSLAASVEVLDLAAAY